MPIVLNDLFNILALCPDEFFQALSMVCAVADPLPRFSPFIPLILTPQSFKRVDVPLPRESV